ncbi:spermine/spermidine synthase domain-containing protein [Anaeromyxobacter paludicola]|uniref:Spermidine synthase n=1 Tax=Anaeromyxobacter paludicola TaxID=2918171 RepID=A0ABN6N9S0_9BACT|nr:hypothetical protein [Anaeromyxobacter paludicola]BDG09983.1 spermidine synthase [Anaeromyxobacter paludicola]
MQPWETVDRARAPDGTELVLARRGEEWVVRAGGHVLMSSRVHGSEEALAALALRRVDRPRAVLLGGLGLGFTLRALLDRLPPDAKVVVTELSPELAGWNRDHVAHLAGRPLDDARARLQVGDVLGRIAEAKGAYDAIVLDVDNGPSALAHAGNQKLYLRKGIEACRDALRGGGVLAVWSAGPDEAYLARLTRAGFDARAEVVPARQGGGQKHVVFVAKKAAGRPVAPRGGAGGAQAPRRATKRRP